MYEKRMCGVVIPTITPMNEDGSIDDALIADFTRYLLEAGVNALYPNGTNGESLLLTKEERDHVAEVMANVNAHRLPLFIQCGSMTTGETASHAAHAVDIGADGVGIMSPAFFQMDEEALFQYYRDVIKGLPENFPVYIYNIPGCTTNDVKPGLLQKLMEEFPNIVGIKYSSPDLMRVEDYLETDGKKPELLIGCDSLFLQCLMTGGVGTVTGPGSIFHERLLKEFNTLARNFHENYLMTARDYAEFGAYEEAVAVLSQCDEAWPMLFYYKAYYLGKMGKDTSYTLLQASQCSTDYCFPNKLEDILVLEYVVREKCEDANAYYYLGNLYYDKMQYDTAIGYWERSAELNPDFAITWRNLSLAYYNKRHDPDQAKQAMERAYELNPGDARIFLELDQLYKKLGMPVAERLKHYDMARDVFMQRDDLMIEYATLLNLSERYGDAYEFIMANRFHPWEGGEGKVTTQYTVSLVELARSAMERGDLDEAEEFLKKALYYPENLGEGKLEGCKDNHVNYYLGVIKERRGDQTAAEAYFEKASVGTDEPAGMMYYNDQPADMIYYQGLAKEKLNRPVEAKARFNKLLDYGEQHIFDVMRVSYFAVSLPDFLIFDDDLNKRNQTHCYYLIGLANLGLGNMDAAAKAFVNAIGLEPTHQNAIRYLHMTGKA